MKIVHLINPQFSPYMFPMHVCAVQKWGEILPFEHLKKISRHKM